MMAESDTSLLGGLNLYTILKVKPISLMRILMPIHHGTQKDTLNLKYDVKSKSCK